MAEYVNLWGEPVAVPLKRGKHYIEPRGHAATPGSGPEGETCGSCAACARPKKTGRPYPKCWKGRARWTCSRKSDIRVSDRACYFWEAKDD